MIEDRLKEDCKDEDYIKELMLLADSYGMQCLTEDQQAILENR